MSYRANPIPQMPVVSREFQRIAEAMKLVVSLESLSREPDNLKAPMLVYADGTNWDPGSGEGLYLYKSTGWVFIG